MILAESKPAVPTAESVATPPTFAAGSTTVLEAAEDKVYTAPIVATHFLQVIVKASYQCQPLKP